MTKAGLEYFCNLQGPFETFIHDAEYTHRRPKELADVCMLTLDADMAQAR